MTLKRKTAAKYNNSSVGQKQFSINGGYRNQGYVGQPIISRSLPRTLMKGNGLRGHGGCCGKFKINPIIQSGLNYQENHNIIKSSVINTEGMLINNYQCIGKAIKSNSSINTKKKLNIVKTDSNHGAITQGSYIDSISRLKVCSFNPLSYTYIDGQRYFDIGNLKNKFNIKPINPELKAYFKRSYIDNRFTCFTITKTNLQIGKSLSQGEYVSYLTSQCPSKNVKPHHSTSQQPFGATAASNLPGQTLSNLPSDLLFASKINIFVPGI